MSTASETKPTIWFWVISSALLFWGLAYAFLVLFTFVLSSGVEILFIAFSIFAVWFAHRAKSRDLIK